MKVTSSVCVVLALLAVVLAPQVGYAAYSQISQNVVGAGGTQNPDTLYTGNQAVKKFSINDAGVNYTLSDDPAVTGTKGTGTVSLYAYYHSSSFDNDPTTNDALFTNGWFDFTFNFTPTGGSPGVYKISGPINGMVLSITQTGPISKIEGEGQWTASTVNLPGTNHWPASGFSSIRSLTINVGQDLSGFNWATQAAQGESLYNIYPDPNAAPEPATLAMLACGAVALIRRRRVA